MGRSGRVARIRGRRGLVLLVLAIGAISGGGAAPDRAAARQNPPPEEVRALWVVRTSITSPAAIRQVIEFATRHGFNTLFVQVRGRGDAYYRSEIEPRAESLAGQPASFDPLAKVLRQARAATGRARLAVHAWINALYVWSSPAPPTARDHLVHRHPDWLMVDRRRGRARVGRDREIFVCPSHPAVRAHLVAIARDVARRYPVDGIQLDYIRYPSADHCHCAGCHERFAHWLAQQRSPRVRAASVARHPRHVLPNLYAAEWEQWRREQIGSLVREIRDAVRAARPEALLSACTVAWGRWPGDFRRTEAYARLAQDWFRWMREGLVDAVAPMTYHRDTEAFQRWVSAVRAAAPGFPVWFGIGAFLCSPESAAEKVAVVRGAGAPGWSLFSYGACTRDGKDDLYLQRMSRYTAMVAE